MSAIELSVRLDNKGVCYFLAGEYSHPSKGYAQEFAALKQLVRD